MQELGRGVTLASGAVERGEEPGLLGVGRGQQKTGRMALEMKIPGCGLGDQGTEWLRGDGGDLEHNQEAVLGSRATGAQTDIWKAIAGEGLKDWVLRSPSRPPSPKGCRGVGSWGRMAGFAPAPPEPPSLPTPTRAPRRAPAASALRSPGVAAALLGRASAAAPAAAAVDASPAAAAACETAPEPRPGPPPARPAAAAPPRPGPRGSPPPPAPASPHARAKTPPAPGSWCCPPPHTGAPALLSALATWLCLPRGSRDQPLLLLHAEFLHTCYSLQENQRKAGNQSLDAHAHPQFHARASSQTTLTSVHTAILLWVLKPAFLPGLPCSYYEQIPSPGGCCDLMGPPKESCKCSVQIM